MEDVTDVVFREVVARFLPKPNVFFTEFVSTDALNSPGRPKALPKLQFTAAQRPVVAQIWGKNPDHYFTSAQLVQELGFDGIDINMGCPERNVLKQGAGAGLIGQNSLVAEIIDATKRGAPQLPLSVKTRIGINSIVTEDWVGFLLQQRLALLTVHGRTAKNMSDVPANWGEIAKAVALRDELAPETLVVGNGDVQSYAQAVSYHQQYGVDGVMIGRGIFANPWVFETSRSVGDADGVVTHAQAEILEVLTKHVQLFDQTWGQSPKFEMLKKFFKMYIKDFAGARELRARLMECHTAQAVLEVIDQELAAVGESSS